MYKNIGKKKKFVSFILIYIIAGDPLPSIQW